MKQRQKVALPLAVLALFASGLACTSRDGRRPPSLPRPSADSTVLTKMHVFKPVLTRSGHAWQALRCDGTDALSGVGQVRLMASATWTGFREKTNEAFRVIYRDGGSSWYTDLHPVLPPDTKVSVVDVVQDLTPGKTDYELKVKGLICPFSATNIPARSDGLISHRTTPSDLVESIRIEIRRYSTGELVPCGASVVGAGRVRATVFVRNDLPAVLDLHMHQEKPADQVIGPSQEGDPATRRWWEFGADDIRVTGGAETKAFRVVADTGGEGTNTFHAAQQHPTHQHDVETFCSFTNVPNR